MIPQGFALKSEFRNSLTQMPEVPVKTVSQITREIKDAVEGNFPYVWVLGEVSNCRRASSGHVYLTLKDESAQLGAVIWRSTAARLKFQIQDGMEVVAAGPVEVYQARGTYQLIVQQLIPQGVGALELAFRQLREKLAAEGLFASERKRPLPQFPRRVALITSPTGAALRDMLQVITRRWRATDIVLLPVAVQGQGAAQEIAAALRMVHRLPDVDVVIAGRGGGSLEDLWPFNEEIVARAIYNCPIPVISAVGHEIDVSISDLVADRRALTPSEAGELVVPHQDDVLNELQAVRRRLTGSLRRRSERAHMQLDAIASRRVFTRPLDRIHDLAARLDDCDDQLRRATKRLVESARLQIAAIAASLQALSPLRVLERGYSITYRHTAATATDELIRTVDQVQPGDELATLLQQGRIMSRVESIQAKTGPFTHKNESQTES